MLHNRCSSNFQKTYSYVMISFLPLLAKIVTRPHSLYFDFDCHHRLDISFSLLCFFHFLLLSRIFFIFYYFLFHPCRLFKFLLICCLPPFVFPLYSISPFSLCLYLFQYLSLSFSFTLSLNHSLFFSSLSLSCHHFTCSFP